MQLVKSGHDMGSVDKNIFNTTAICVVGEKEFQALDVAIDKVRAEMKKEK